MEEWQQESHWLKKPIRSHVCSLWMQQQRIKQRTKPYGKRTLNPEQANPTSETQWWQNNDILKPFSRRDGAAVGPS